MYGYLNNDGVSTRMRKGSERPYGFHSLFVVNLCNQATVAIPKPYWFTPACGELELECTGAEHVWPAAMVPSSGLSKSRHVRTCRVGLKIDMDTALSFPMGPD